ncbi:MAG: GNAT family N-acetyltransferase [Bacteroidota bacterium]
MIQIEENKDYALIQPLLEGVQNFHAELFPGVYKPFSNDDIRTEMQRYLSDPQCRIFVAQLNGDTIGYIMVLIKEIQENAFHYSYRIMHIDQISVSKIHQKTGVGSMLMDKVEELAKELSIARLELDHLHINTKAATFFRSKTYMPYKEKLFKTLN